MVVDTHYIGNMIQEKGSVVTLECGGCQCHCREGVVVQVLMKHTGGLVDVESPS